MCKKLCGDRLHGDIGYTFQHLHVGADLCVVVLKNISTGGGNTDLCKYRVRCSKAGAVDSGQSSLSNGTLTVLS